MFDFLNYPNKTYNLELYWPVIFLGGSEEPRKKEKWLDGAVARLTALKQILIDGSMKDHRSKSKFFGGVQVNLQGLIGVIIYKSGGVAQGLLNALE